MGKSNRSGGSSGPGGGIQFVPLVDDEQDTYAAGSPPALVSPSTYSLSLISASVSIGRPRLVAELFAQSSAQRYLWFTDVVGFGQSGKLIACAHIGADSSENALDACAIYRTTDYGVTWSPDLQYDIPYFRSSGGEPRWYESGKIWELGSYFRADPIGQARNFVTHRAYYANGGDKRVTYPWTARIRNLPQDIKPFTPTQFASTKPHNCSHLIFSQSDVVRLADNSLGWSLYVNYVGDTYMTQVYVRSTDEGLTWNYVTAIGGDETGLNEASICTLASGALLFVSRCNGPTSPETDHVRTSISTNSGTTWSTPAIPQSVSGQGAAGVTGSSPTMRRLANGALVIAHGVPGHFISVCKDGGQGGAGAGGASAWQRLNITDHHNLHATAGTVANDNLGAGLIRYFRGQTYFYTSGYVAMEVTGPNRVTVLYDYCPSGRNPIGTTTSEPHQLYCMDIDVS